MDTPETLQNEGVDVPVEEFEENVVVKTTFCMLNLDPNETLTVYDALRVYLRVLGEQADQPLDIITTTAALLKTLKPAAVQVAQSRK